MSMGDVVILREELAPKRQWLGHKSIQHTERYAEPAPVQKFMAGLTWLMIAAARVRRRPARTHLG